MAELDFIVLSAEELSSSIDWPDKVKLEFLNFARNIELVNQQLDDEAAEIVQLQERVEQLESDLAALTAQVDAL